MGGLSFADGREWDCRSTLEHSSTLRLSSWSRLQKDIGQSVQNGLLVEIEHLSRLPLKRMEHQMEIGRSRLEEKTRPGYSSLSYWASESTLLEKGMELQQPVFVAKSKYESDERWFSFCWIFSNSAFSLDNPHFLVKCSD